MTIPTITEAVPAKTIPTIAGAVPAKSKRTNELLSTDGRLKAGRRSIIYGTSQRPDPPKPPLLPSTREALNVESFL